MRRLVIAALVATAVWTGVPAANAVCAHSHDGSTHVHSGACSLCTTDDATGDIPACVGIGGSIPVVDQAVCQLAAVVNTQFIQC